jgi:hypothetical protein
LQRAAGPFEIRTHAFLAGSAAAAEKEKRACSGGNESCCRERPNDKE